MPLPLLAVTGSACTRCGFVGRAIPNVADAKKDLAQAAAILFGGLAIGALAMSAAPHKQGDLCPDCQVPGSLVPITSGLAKQGLERAFGKGATIGDYLLATEGILPITIKGSGRLFKLTDNGLVVEKRYTLLATDPLLAYSYRDVRDVQYLPLKLFVQQYNALRIEPESGRRPNFFMTFLNLDNHELRFSFRYHQHAQLFQEAFRAIKRTVSAA